MHKNPWKIVGFKEIYDNNWIHLKEYKVINPRGGSGIYGKVFFKNRAVGIVAMDAEKNIYLVGQYRFTLDQYSWEIPEGGSPEHEDLLISAKRELKEETGIQAYSWQRILDMHLSNSVTNEFGCVFLATELEFGEAEPEETEELILRKIPLDEAIAMINNGEITDSLTVAGLLKTKLLTLEK